MACHERREAPRNRVLERSVLNRSFQLSFHSIGPETSDKASIHRLAEFFPLRCRWHLKFTTFPLMHRINIIFYAFSMFFLLIQRLRK